MTSNPRGPSRFGFGFPFVGIAVLIVAAILAGGISVAVIPGIVVAAALWVVIWIAGGQIGDAFADWLDRRWHK
jgi:hypothetical protein